MTTYAPRSSRSRGSPLDGQTVTVCDDQGPRADTTYEKIAALPPVYRPDGRITAATSSGQADGAAVCLLMSGAEAARRGLTPLARIHTIAAGACAPTDLIRSAIPATARAFERSGLTQRDMSVIEVNEAFASAPIALMREFGIDDDARVNPNGGACALGHPVGASGARLVGTTASSSGAAAGATVWRPSAAADTVDGIAHLRASARRMRTPQFGMRRHQFVLRRSATSAPTFVGPGGTLRLFTAVSARPPGKLSRARCRSASAWSSCRRGCSVITRLPTPTPTPAFGVGDAPRARVVDVDDDGHAGRDVRVRAGREAGR